MTFPDNRTEEGAVLWEEAISEVEAVLEKRFGPTAFVVLALPRKKRPDGTFSADLRQLQSMSNSSIEGGRATDEMVLTCAARIAHRRWAERAAAVN